MSTISENEGSTVAAEYRIWRYRNRKNGNTVIINAARLIGIDQKWVTLEFKSSKRFKKVLLDDVIDFDLEHLKRAGYRIFKTNQGLYVNPPPRCIILSIEKTPEQVRKELAAEFDMTRTGLRYYASQYKKACVAGIRKREAENKRRLVGRARAALALMHVAE